VNTTNWLFLAGAIVVAGKWARGEEISPKTVIAVVILALMITVLQDVDADVANAFTILILVTVVLGNMTPILSKLNMSIGIESEGTIAKKAFQA
jgi:hypothetical protein